MHGKVSNTLGRGALRLLFAGVDHVGFAVRNLDKAIGDYQDLLGFKVEGVHTLTERKVRVAFLSTGGNSRIELLEPLDMESTIAKFLETRDEGIHHIAMKVKGIEKMLEEFKRRGVVLIDEKPKAGAEGSKIAFVHPKSTHGVLLELVERT